MEGRKDAKWMKRMEEEESKCQKRKIRNITEKEKSETKELVSSTDNYRELQRGKESSCLFWWEGAVNKSPGFEENLYLDGIKLDITQRLPADSTECREDD